MTKETQANLSYRDIKREVLERIQNRTWAPDSLLPSEVELAEAFSSTRTTVNRALRELADEGYLERRRKAGTRVLRAPVRQARFSIPITREQVEATGAPYRYFLLSSDQVHAPDRIAARLDLKPKQMVLHLRCLHYAGNAPYQYEERWIVTDTVPQARGVDFSHISPNEWLINTVPVSNVELTFTAAAADAEVAEIMETAQGNALFVVERSTWLKDAPVTFARMYHAPGYRVTTTI